MPASKGLAVMVTSSNALVFGSAATADAQALKQHKATAVNLN
jgi:hypothetical protein